AAVAERFPHGRLLVAPGVGHTVIGSSPCVDTAVQSWTRHKTPPARCQRVPLPTPPVQPLPSSVAAATPIGSSGLAGRTLRATVLTLREAEASWLTSYPGGWVVGLEGGLAPA